MPDAGKMDKIASAGDCGDVAASLKQGDASPPKNGGRHLRERTAMQRVTMTIDDDLMASLDAYMEASGHQNRSEAVRDLVRAGLMKQREKDDADRLCIGALVYLYDHDTRQLSKRLTSDHHSNADLSIATLHVHVDAETCLEVSLLRGRKSDVEHFAQHVIGERGVRYGQLVVAPAEAHTPSSDPSGHGHTHSHD
jgi:CopG family transcriptional regulator, nickel-responsive regulator